MSHSQFQPLAPVVPLSHCRMHGGPLCVSSIKPQRSPGCVGVNCKEGVEMTGLQLSSWVEYLAPCSSMLGLGWGYVPVLASVHGLCAWLCYCIGSLCAHLEVQGPSEVGFIVNVAASQVFCCCGELSPECNGCHPHERCYDIHKSPP